MSKAVYIINGAVRGWCGHKHRYYRTAEKCLENDQIGANSQGGYSDRIIQTHKESCDNYPNIIGINGTGCTGCGPELRSWRIIGMPYEPQ